MPSYRTPFDEAAGRARCIPVPGNIWRQNVEGTHHVIGLTRAAGIRSLICCSAYSVGQGRIAETLHPLSRAFNNFDEESKCLAEHEVRSRLRGRGDCVGHPAPSIAVGLCEGSHKHGRLRLASNRRDEWN